MRIKNIGTELQVNLSAGLHPISQYDWSPPGCMLVCRRHVSVSRGWSPLPIPWVLVQHPAAPPLFLKSLITSLIICPPATANDQSFTLNPTKGFRIYPTRIRSQQPKRGSHSIQTDCAKTPEEQRVVLELFWNSSISCRPWGCYWVESETI